MDAPPPTTFVTLQEMDVREEASKIWTLPAYHVRDPGGRSVAMSRLWTQEMDDQDMDIRGAASRLWTS
jgi:hypothetical protein